MSDPEKPKVPAKPKRDPTALSSEYHRAHKQLMLWSAILFIWEFIGIDLEQAKSAEGYAGALVKSLKSPQAIPWVLLALVVYFAVKCMLEWAQCHIERRKVPVARIDLLLALIFAGSTLLLYFLQTVRGIQVADIIQRNSTLAPSVTWGASFGFSLGLMFVFFGPLLVANGFPLSTETKFANLVNWATLVVSHIAVFTYGTTLMVHQITFKVAMTTFFITLIISVTGSIAVWKLKNQLIAQKLNRLPKVEP